MSAATLEYVEISTTDVPGDAAHIVLSTGAKTPQALVMEARVEGLSVTALCGYQWVPQRDPAPLPVCAACLEIYRHDPNGHGDRDNLPAA